MKGVKPKLIALFFGLSLLAASAADRPVKIALLSDPHVNFRTNGTAATFGRHFEQAIQAVNAEGVDVVLIAGDLGNTGLPEEWDAFDKYIKKFQAPVFYVPGNHDVGHKFNSGKREGTVTAGQVEAFEKALGRSYFATNCAGVRIIGVNSSLLGSGLPAAARQWEFLEKELAKPSATPTVLFMHYPLFLLSPDEKGGNYYNLEPEPRKRLMKLLQRGGVNAVLAGHLHHSLVHRWEGILLLSTPAISFGLPNGKSTVGWTLVTLPKDGEAAFEMRDLR